MGIGLTDAVVPLGTFPIAQDDHLLGSYRSVVDSAARDAIPYTRRKAGMLVRTNDSGITYVLGSGLTNGDWTPYTVGSGGLGDTGTFLRQAKAGALRTIVEPSSGWQQIGVAGGTSNVGCVFRGVFYYATSRTNNGVQIYQIDPVRQFSSVVGVSPSSTEVATDFLMWDDGGDFQAQAGVVTDQGVYFVPIFPTVDQYGILGAFTYAASEFPAGNGSGGRLALVDGGSVGRYVWITQPASNSLAYYKSTDYAGTTGTVDPGIGSPCVAITWSGLHGLIVATATGIYTIPVSGATLGAPSLVASIAGVKDLKFDGQKILALKAGELYGIDPTNGDDPIFQKTGLSSVTANSRLILTDMGLFGVTRTAADGGISYRDISGEEVTLLSNSVAALDNPRSTAGALLPTGHAALVNTFDYTPPPDTVGPNQFSHYDNQVLALGGTQDDLQVYGTYSSYFFNPNPLSYSNGSQIGKSVRLRRFWARVNVFSPATGSNFQFNLQRVPQVGSPTTITSVPFTAPLSGFVIVEDTTLLEDLSPTDQLGLSIDTDPGGGSDSFFFQVIWGYTFETTHNFGYTTVPGPDVSYNVALGSGTLVGGTTDIGLYGDDFTTSISLPFPVTLYDQTYTSVTVSTNGNLQFASSNGALSGDLPYNGFSFAIAAFWTDLSTGGVNEGIFTGVTGSSPSRVFHIEWRAHDLSNSNPLNFEVLLHEDTANFEIAYGIHPGGDSNFGDIGVQYGDGSSNSTVYQTNNFYPATNAKLSFTLPPIGPPTLPTVASGFTAGEPSIVGGFTVNLIINSVTNGSDTFRATIRRNVVAFDFVTFQEAVGPLAVSFSSGLNMVLDEGDTVSIVVDNVTNPGSSIDWDFVSERIYWSATTLGMDPVSEDTWFYSTRPIATITYKHKPINLLGGTYTIDLHINSVLHHSHTIPEGLSEVEDTVTYTPPSLTMTNGDSFHFVLTTTGVEEPWRFYWDTNPFSWQFDTDFPSEPRFQVATSASAVVEPTTTGYFDRVRVGNALSAPLLRTDSLGVVSGGLLHVSNFVNGNFVINGGFAPQVDVFCNTQAGSFTVTLPGFSMISGDRVTIVDYKGNAAVNNITISPGGNNVDGSGTPEVFNTNWFAVTYEWVGADNRWKKVAFFPASGGGGITVQEEGSTVQTGVTKVNFIGSAVTAVFDGGPSRINVTVAPKVTIQDEGSAVEDTAIVNFIGSGVTSVWNPGQSRVDVTIPGASGAGGMIQVADRTALAAYSLTGLAEGHMAFVNSQKGYYILTNTSLTTSVQAVASDTGGWSWRRLIIPSPYYENSSDFYVYGATGDDESPTNNLKTFEEVWCRLGGRLRASNYITINVVEDTDENIHLVFDPIWEGGLLQGGTSAILVNGSPTSTLATGVVTAVTPRDNSTTATLISDTTTPTNWASYEGKQLVFTSGAAVNSAAFVSKNLGGNQARIQQSYLANNVPTVGSTFQIAQYPIMSGSVYIDVRGNRGVGSPASVGYNSLEFTGSVYGPGGTQIDISNSVVACPFQPKAGRYRFYSACLTSYNVWVGTNGVTETEMRNCVIRCPTSNPPNITDGCYFVIMDSLIEAGGIRFYRNARGGVFRTGLYDSTNSPSFAALDIFDRANVTCANVFGNNHYYAIQINTGGTLYVQGNSTTFDSTLYPNITGTTQFIEFERLSQAIPPLVAGAAVPALSNLSTRAQLVAAPFTGLVSNYTTGTRIFYGI